MFLMVYFHYRPVCLEQLLYRYFKTSPNEYTIPADIEEYQKHDDHFLLKHLRNSTNQYAAKIIKNEIPQKIFESFNEKLSNGNSSFLVSPLLSTDFFDALNSFSS